jgi:hypothetical protein
MRFPNGLLAGVAGLLAVGLIGCSGSSAEPAPYPGSASPSSSSQAAPVPAESTGTQTGAAEPLTKAGAHAAAAKFYRLYSTGQFAAMWDLLTLTAQRAVPRTTWVNVHANCPSVGAGTGRVIESVLVFGNAAIVTETVKGAASKLGTSHDVFNYANGHWAYAPNDLNIYHHGSVAADIAAAKAHGFCTSQKATPL